MHYSCRLIQMCLFCLLGSFLSFIAHSTEYPANQKPVLDAYIPTIEPEIVQAGGILTLTFPQDVKLSAIKIDQEDLQLIDREVSKKEFQTAIPEKLTAGRHMIKVEFSEEPGKQFYKGVLVFPGIEEIKFSKNQKSPVTNPGFILGKIFTIYFKEAIPVELTKDDFKVEIDNIKTTIFQVGKDYLEVMTEAVRTNPGTSDGAGVTGNIGKILSSPMKLRVRNVLMANDQRLHRISVESSYLLASGITIAIILLLYLFYKSSAGEQPYSFLTMTLLEPENKTYSLSRLQFVLWLLAIVWSYLLLYFQNGFATQIWKFPNIGQAVYCFLISLSTLVVAIATKNATGPKGADQVEPRLADLFYHGGVLALDRVQQFTWTLIAVGMFIGITTNASATADSLPEISSELLVLMGLSSAGYLGGKFVRGAGPIIHNVDKDESSGVFKLKIKGENLSTDSFIWMDGKRELTAAAGAPYPDKPGFTKQITIQPSFTADAWTNDPHNITVINPDAQRADWKKDKDPNPVPAIPVASPATPEAINVQPVIAPQTPTPTPQNRPNLAN